MADLVLGSMIKAGTNIGEPRGLRESLGEP